MFSDCKTDQYNNKIYYNNSGELYLIEWVGGTKFWYQDGQVWKVKYSNETTQWWIGSRRFNSEEEWFQALSPENKLKMIWQLGTE